MPGHLNLITGLPYQKEMMITGIYAIDIMELTVKYIGEVTSSDRSKYPDEIRYISVNIRIVSIMNRNRQIRRFR